MCSLFLMFFSPQWFSKLLLISCLLLYVISYFLYILLSLIWSFWCGQFCLRWSQVWCVLFDLLCLICYVFFYLLCYQLAMLFLCDQFVLIWCFAFNMVSSLLSGLFDLMCSLCSGQFPLIWCLWFGLLRSLWSGDFDLLCSYLFVHTNGLFFLVVLSVFKWCLSIKIRSLAVTNICQSEESEEETCGQRAFGGARRK